MTTILFLLSSSLWAQQFSPAHPPIVSLCRSYYQSIDKGEKEKILKQISQTAPATPIDVQYDFDLYMRYPQPLPRAAVMSSLSLLKGPNRELASVFLGYLSHKDPQILMFAIEGAFQLRSQRALPIIEKIAKSKFKFSGPEQATLLKDKQMWATHYEALDALALWEGDKAFKLIVKKAEQAPSVARILASRFWSKTLPLLVDWAKSNSAAKRAMGDEAAATEIPMSVMEKSYNQMLAIVENNRLPNNLRHQLAIKVGISASEDQIKDLIKKYQSLSDEDEKMMIETALFASRSHQVIPILVHYAKTNPDPIRRTNARLELKELMDPAQYRGFLEWVVKNDPDSENRKEASQELSSLGGS